MTSVQDVAKLAGVSPATVSRVLSGSDHPVSEATRQRVLDVVAELGFRPNLLARGLVTSRTRTIGAIVHDISDPYFGEIVRGLEDLAHANGYRVLMCSSDRDPDRELVYVEALLDHRVDAILFAGGGLEDRAYRRRVRALLDGFRENGGKVVLLAPSRLKAPSVVTDNRGAAAVATEHLLGLGHRRIACVGGPPTIRTSGLRLEGYRDALRAAGIPVDPDLEEPGDFTLLGGAKAVAELLDRRPDLTAIFAANDVMAFGVLQELAVRQVTVPDDVSVVGFDDVQMASYVQPPLTTVAVGAYRMGEEGVRMALALLDGERVRSRTHPSELVVRASTAPLSRQRQGENR